MLSRLARGQWAKYVALGNDYLVMVCEQDSQVPEPQAVRLLCDRHLGLGSDGLLVHLPSADPSLADARLRIFNPDGSEAEKSGNGLRIFARYLFDWQAAAGPQMRVALGKDVITATLYDVEPDACGAAPAKIGGIRVAMGQATLGSEAVGYVRACGLNGQLKLTVANTSYDATLVSMGNPHCVVFGASLDESDVRKAGAAIEQDSAFLQRTNVQFVSVDGPQDLSIRIWERGAGYTLASGSSSCAAAVAAIARGLVQSPVTVNMPGGQLQVSVDAALDVELDGPASPVFATAPWTNQALGLP